MLEEALGAGCILTEQVWPQGCPYRRGESKVERVLKASERSKWEDRHGG